MSYRYRKIKDFREDHDLKQREVAKELGIRQDQYSRYERGYIEMPTHLVREFSLLYGVSIDELVREMEWVDLTS